MMSLTERRERLKAWSSVTIIFQVSAGRSDHHDPKHGDDLKRNCQFRIITRRMILVKRTTTLAFLRRMGGPGGRRNHVY